MRKPGALALLLVGVLCGTALAWFDYALDEPINKLTDNSAVDIVYDGTYIWLATGNGLSGSSNGGVSWRTFNRSTGFTQSSISALATNGLRLWAATSYEIDIGDGQPVPAGGGLEITDDYGVTFQHVDSEQFASAGMLSYDLAVSGSTVWSACYYGGLVRSLDYGETWENVFISDAFRRDYENEEFDSLGARYFSLVLDPYHDDSLIVWAGSAAGAQALYYIGKSKKLASNQINDISYDGVFWWYATDRGLSRLNDTLFSLFGDTVVTTHTFLTYDESDGFPGNYVSAVGAEGDLICAAVFDTLTQVSQGLAVSTDGGASWTAKDPEQATGAGRMVEEIEVFDGYIWAGCNEGGFIRSSDQGQTWRNFYLDSTVTEPTDLRNVVHGFDISPREDFTKVLVGTDSGVVLFYFSDLEQLDSTGYLNAFDNVTHGQRVVSVVGFLHEGEEQVWGAAHPYRPESGAVYAVIRYLPAVGYWETFISESPPVIPYDIELLRLESATSIWVAHSYGLYYTTDYGDTWIEPWLRDRISRYPLWIEVGDDVPFLSVEASDTALHVGSETDGALEMVVPTSDWYLFPAQIDPLQFDAVGRAYRSGGFFDTSTTIIGGNFVVAMGLQRTGDSTIIWAATRPTGSGRTGASITSDQGRTWREAAEGVAIWNFDFNGDSVFLAADQGLLMSTDFGATWQEYEIYDPTSGRAIGADVPVYSVRLIEGEIWVGTDDGIAKSSDGINWEIFREFYPISQGAADTYVSPNPFSPYISSGQLKFHYRLLSGGEVTIKIYDFANNLVKVVADGVGRDGGVQYDDLDLWDGTNERGDIVAAGVYVYVIQSSGGDELWGKLMVLP